MTIHDVDAAWVLAGAVFGGAACFFTGYYCALMWVAAEMERLRTDLDGSVNNCVGGEE